MNKRQRKKWNKAALCSTDELKALAAAGALTEPVLRRMIKKMIKRARKERV